MNSVNRKLFFLLYHLINNFLLSSDLSRTLEVVLICRQLTGLVPSFPFTCVADQSVGRVFIFWLFSILGIWIAMPLYSGVVSISNLCSVSQGPAISCLLILLTAFHQPNALSLYVAIHYNYNSIINIAYQLLHLAVLISFYQKIITVPYLIFALKR